MDKNKSKKGAMPIIAIIALVIAIGGAAYIGQKYFVSKPTPPPILAPIPKPSLEINFSEVGNILNWDVQTESYTDDWTLLYEKPGNPAISVNLNFNENSLCDIGEGDELCDKNKFSNGDRAKVEGNRVNNKVTVIKLEKIGSL